MCGGAERKLCSCNNFLHSGFFSGAGGFSPGLGVFHVKFLCCYYFSILFFQFSTSAVSGEENLKSQIPNKWYQEHRFCQRGCREAEFQMQSDLM